MMNSSEKASQQQAAAGLQQQLAGPALSLVNSSARGW